MLSRCFAVKVNVGVSRVCVRENEEEEKETSHSWERAVCSSSRIVNHSKCVPLRCHLVQSIITKAFFVPLAHPHLCHFFQCPNPHPEGENAWIDLRHHMQPSR